MDCGGAQWKVDNRADEYAYLWPKGDRDPTKSDIHLVRTRGPFATRAAALLEELLWTLELMRANLRVRGAACPA